MKKIALFSMLTFSVLSLSLAGCGNKKTASTNDSKPNLTMKTMMMTIIVNARARGKFSAMIIVRIMMRRHLIMH